MVEEIHTFHTTLLCIYHCSWHFGMLYLTCYHAILWTNHLDYILRYSLDSTDILDQLLNHTTQKFVNLFWGFYAHLLHAISEIPNKYSKVSTSFVGLSLPRRPRDHNCSSSWIEIGKAFSQGAILPPLDNCFMQLSNVLRKSKNSSSSKNL